MIHTICEYFFWFQLYSIAGWIVETLLYIIRDKKFVKRGFLFGPLCPIYGTAAVICTALLYGKIHNIFLLFLVGTLLCGSLEYVTHFIMEKLFHAMWWDYSTRRFNIKGRIYLNGVLTFGVGVVLIVRLIQPVVYKLTNLIPHTALYIICFVLYTIFIFDIASTLADLKGIINTLKSVQVFALSTLQKGIDITDEKISEAVNSVKGNDTVSGMIDWLKNDNTLIKRIHKKYPDFTLKKYKGVLDIIMDRPQEENARSDIKLYGTADSLPSADNINQSDKKEG